MNIRLGIIGGGQLGLYLCEAAQALGFHVSVITGSEQDPAVQCADSSLVGHLDDRELIERFLDGCDVVTFDKEGVPNETLDWLADAQLKGRVNNRPDAQTLLMLKDKALQKTWLQQHDLPTLPFQVLSGRACLGESISAEPGRAVVQKARCDGYDGRGVQILHSLVAEQQLWDIPSIVEPYYANCKEISVVTARDQRGSIQTYPPVSMEFDHQLNSVKVVAMPAAVSPDIGTAASRLAERVVTLLDGVGVFAIEMFVTPEGELLINEISPRVHNSGHLTLDGCNVSQFEQHVRAVAGLPLLPVATRECAVMLNILYSDALKDHCPASPVVDRKTQPGATIYWYGKTPGQPGRKMGHINAVASSAEIAEKLADGALATLSSNTGEQNV